MLTSITHTTLTFPTPNYRTKPFINNSSLKPHSTLTLSLSSTTTFLPNSPKSSIAQPSTMAPHGESVIGSYARSNNISKPPRLSSNGLKRTVSDISFEISKEAVNDDIMALAPISEVEDAKCECCGMIEECTPEYILKIQNMFFGKWICGLCSEAVKEEKTKNGGNGEEALSTHMSACVRFNKVGRAYPVLCQAEAMKKLLKKSKSLSPRDKATLPSKGGIARSSSCMSSINELVN